jgi:predicted DNA-binding ribbon-helix-helix protein
MPELITKRSASYFETRVRSVRVAGVVRSIQLENGFWRTLEDMAREREMSVGAFITILYEEMTERGVGARNFTSALRCACLVHLGAAGRQGPADGGES